MPATAYQKRIERAAGLEIHEVGFARNTRTGMWRAVCSCGWILVGAEDEVKSRAAGHDLEWEPAV